LPDSYSTVRFRCGFSPRDAETAPLDPGS